MLNYNTTMFDLFQFKVYGISYKKIILNIYLILEICYIFKLEKESFMSDISKELIRIIKDVLKIKFDYNDDNNLVMIEIPKEKIHGDYSTNIAMRLAKVLHNSPLNIANSIKDSFFEYSLVKNVEVVAPGFINFYLNQNSLSSVIKKVLELGTDYGRGEKKNGKIMVEYVSANPTGDLHLGHARGAAYGDALTRIMKFANYDVLREYYVNDAGNQINVLANSLFERYKEALSLPIDLEKVGYQGQDVKILANNIKEQDGDCWLKVDEKEAIEHFKNVGIELELNKIKKDLNLYRVSFDHYQSERELYSTLKVEKTLKLLKKSQYSYERDGALWLKTTDFGDDKDRVLIKSDGTLTYLTPDIAYHKDKFDRGYDELIDILGADHHGYIARLKAGIEIMGYNPDALKVLIVQIVRLMENGEEVKMSKRTGNAVTIRELCEDVGVDVARYFFISKPIDSHLDFDLSLARKQSADNPVYYIQYAYARIASILSRDNSFILKDEYPLLINDKEIELIKLLDAFPKEIEDIAKSKEVNKLCNYVYKLAQNFHSYYNENRVIDESNKDLTVERLSLLKAISIVLKTSLELLGVEAKEKM